MRPPVGYAVRPASLQDIVAIEALFRAYDRWLLGFADPSADQLEDDFRTPGFDPAHDTWYVTSESDESLVGFVLYKDSEPGEDGSQGFGRVDPVHRGRGIGAFLIDAVLERWRASDAHQDRIYHWLTPGDAAADALFATRGYQPVRREYHLERPLANAPTPTAPDGLEIRTMRPGEERRLHAVNDEAFAGHWGFRPSAFADWCTMLDIPGSDPERIWLAIEGDEVVGELILWEQGEVGWIEVLGVRPAWRGRGIGRALLRTGFVELARRGCDAVRLGVDVGNETGALRLYESEGMTVRREWHVMENRLG